MIVGNPDTFAIESEIAEAYERLSLRALGFFVIHVMGRSFGFRAPDATMLAIAFDGVSRRIDRRGAHTCPIAPDTDARQIATVFSHENDLDVGETDQLFGVSYAQFNKLLHSNECVWAPDSEEGFDDGSRILHFGSGSMVRLIAFHSTGDYDVDSGSLRDVWLSQDEFYRVLEEWRDRFEEERLSLL